MNKRQCYYIPVDQFDEHGYIPSLVTEGEWGHSPMSGSDSTQVPWYWGKTFAEAKETCRQVNRESFGLSEEEALGIVISMRASRAGG